MGPEQRGIEVRGAVRWIFDEAHESLQYLLLQKGSVPPQVNNPTAVSVAVGNKAAAKDTSAAVHTRQDQLAPPSNSSAAEAVVMSIVAPTNSKQYQGERPSLVR